MERISKKNAAGRFVAERPGHRVALSNRSVKLGRGKGLQRGFSLIEMSVYLAVSGLLLSALVPLSVEVIAKARDLTNQYESATDRMRVLNGKKPIRPEANPYVIKTLDYSAYINSAGVEASLKTVNERAAANDAAQKIVAAGTNNALASSESR